MWSDGLCRGAALQNHKLLHLFVHESKDSLGRTQIQHGFYATLQHPLACLMVKARLGMKLGSEASDDDDFA